MLHQIIGRWPRQSAALFLALSLLLAACGDGDSTTADQAGSQPTATQETADVDPTDGPEDGESADPPAEPDPSATPEPQSAEDSEDDPARAENPAPEFGSIDSWHNSEPLSLTALRGSPVLLVFWADF